MARAKGAAWNAEHARDLYPVLNGALTEMGLGAGLAEALLALEERGAPPPNGDDDDLIVACPIDGGGVSLRFSCGRCRWHGPRERSCLLPAARAYAACAEAIARLTAPRPSLR